MATAAVVAKANPENKTVAPVDPRKAFEEAETEMKKVEADLAVAVAREKEASKARRHLQRAFEDATARAAKAALALVKEVKK